MNLLRRSCLADALTALAASSAVIVLSIHVYRAARPTLALPETRQIDNWHEYGLAGHRTGGDAPAVTIVEFLDFGCSICARAVSFLDSLQREFPDQIAIVYRHYPLSDESYATAAASECAGRLGMFKAFHDEVFRQRQLNPDSIITRLELDRAQYVSCMAYKAYLQRMAADSQATSELGITGTPTFLVNGRLLRGFPGSRSFGALISHELERGSVE